MIPIHQLLSRIRWDREFGRGDFIIGYYNRLHKEIIRVGLTAIIFPDDDQPALRIIDAEGVPQTVPLHRIREVYRNHRLIWQRPGADRPTAT